jgi:acetolactate synthase I/II/III large subunit
VAAARQGTGAQHLVASLLANGVTHGFCVPGESYLAVLDALVDAPGVRLVTCRHEAAAANMAEAHGKLTGRPGIAFVTRGPGATHASIGVHTAFQDSSPMILFIGQVARDQRDREAFQEVDYRRFFSPLAKWVEEIDDAARVPEYVNRAFAIAMNGRPGPVVLALPEDMLTDVVEAVIPPPAPKVEAAPRAEDMAALQSLLNEAKSPLLLLGGPGWTAHAIADMRRFIDAWQIPVATSFRAKDLIDNRHPCYAGDVGIAPNPALAQQVREADLLIACGPRLGEMTTSGYSLLSSPLPLQKLVHLHPGAEELGRVFHPVLAMQCSMPQAARAFMALMPGKSFADQAREAHSHYERWIEPHADGLGVNLSRIFAHLDVALPADAIVCNGAGNYAAWLHRFVQHKSWKTQLAPTSGAMGYGLPAAIAAKVMNPDRMVIAVAGDGCFMMAAPELATAIHERASIIVLVINNGQFGTIRMHQERDYPKRQSATKLTNPDFVAFAKSFGFEAWRVTRTEDFAAAFDAVRSHGGPSLIEIVTHADDIAPGRSLSQ